MIPFEKEHDAVAFFKKLATMGQSDENQDDMKHDQMDIAVGVCTYNRIADLTALLQSVRGLSVPADINLQIIIVDNDPARSAQQCVEDWAGLVPWSVRYLMEPEPGIPAARNRVLQQAGQDGYLAFVDDDETVHPDWIVELAQAMRQTGAAFVQGPVEMTVDNPQQAWWLTSGFFRQARFDNLALRHESWSNNVLIDLAFVSKHGCRFDPALRFDGGSDTLFFQDIVAAGGEGRFAEHAVVFEIQKPSRLTWSWGIKRHYRYGITRANTVVMRKSLPAAVGFCVPRGAAMVVLGALNLPMALVSGRKALADGMALMARGVGVFSGLLGGTHREYAR